MPAFPCPAAPGAACPRPPSSSASARTAREFDLADTPPGLVHRLDRPLPGHLPRRGRRATCRGCSTLLADEGVLSVRAAGDGATRVYGLQPGHIRVRLLETRRGAGDATLGCDTCHWEQVVPPERRATGRASPAPATAAPARCAARSRTPRDLRATTTTATSTPGRCPTRWSPPSTSARCPARSASRSSAPSATAPGTTTRTCCPARPPWNSASTSATCPP